MRIVVCLDKFRGSATAREACRALAGGLRAADPAAEVVERPVADGGEGTVAALVDAGWTPHDRTVTGPAGTPVTARFAMRAGRAVVELAEASGLHLLDSPAPRTASTHGTGELLAAALAAGARELVLTLGGSATTDAGAGLLEALGARLRDAHGDPPAPGGVALAGLAAVDLAPAAPDVPVVVATDVDNPLLGERGAARVFGPQKGAGPRDVADLERGLARFADLVAAATGADHRDDPGAGAAGGAGFAALAGLRARRVPGVDLVLRELGVTAALAGADLVVVGEGRLDAQSLAGKAPLGVARLAAEQGVPVVAVAGALDVPQARLAEAGIVRSYAVTDVAAGEADALAGVARHLDTLGHRLIADLTRR